MISIVIPIYNQDVRPLVFTLAKQCNKLNINYQILCFDDGSTLKYKEKNRELAFKININYTEMTENLGRSKIRNWLGKAAFFDYILFLDGDSSVKSKDFVKTYIQAIPTEGIIYGGRKYAAKKPINKKKILHWKYGTKREALTAKIRNRDPYLNFQSNNFVIPEKIFKEHFFDEKVEGYGYEDLLYAFQLQKHQISITHIDNPVLHDGLENNEIFLNKTRNAIENLSILYKQQKIRTTRLIKSYQWLEAYHLTKLVDWIGTQWHDKILDNMMSENPSIFIFNLWKLHYFIQLQKQ